MFAAAQVLPAAADGLFVLPEDGREWVPVPELGVKLIGRFRYEVLLTQLQASPMSAQERDFLLGMARRLSGERTALKLRVRELEAGR